MGSHHLCLFIQAIVRCENKCFNLCREYIKASCHLEVLYACTLALSSRHVCCYLVCNRCDTEIRCRDTPPCMCCSTFATYVLPVTHYGQVLFHFFSSDLIIKYTSIVHQIENPLRRTSEHNRKYNNLNFSFFHQKNLLLTSNFF